MGRKRVDPDMIVAIVYLVSELTPLVVSGVRCIGRWSLRRKERRLAELRARQDISDELDARRDAYMELCAAGDLDEAARLYPDVDDMVNPGLAESKPEEPELPCRVA